MTENNSAKIPIEQKCPNCGHTLAFDPSNQSISCNSCDSSFTPESIGDDSCLFEEIHSWEEDEAIMYHCPSCGGDLIFGKNDTVTTCAYCGNNLVLGERLKGERRPNRIIPFAFDKETAKQHLKKYLDRYKGRNSNFCNNAKIKRLDGLYVPIWTYSTKMYGKATVNCYTKSSKGKTTLNYAGKTRRGGSAIYWNVPVDGSSNMSDEFMESIEPFNFKKSVPFDTSYLMGFCAQKYDLNETVCYRRAKQRMANHMLMMLKNDVSNFDKFDAIDMIAKAPVTFVNYVMAPVWIATMEWQGKDHTFIINGQTGITKGNIPANTAAIMNKKIAYAVLMHIPSILIVMLFWALGLNIVFSLLAIVPLEFIIFYLFKRIKWSINNDKIQVKLKYGADLYYEPNSLNIMFRDKQYL